MKKIVIISIVFGLIINGLTFSADNDKINKCLQILSEKVKDNYNIDLQDVVINGDSVNLSKYKNAEGGKFSFSEVLVENPSQIGCEYAMNNMEEFNCEDDGKKLFFAKRNNIGTLMIHPEIEGTGYWTATEFTTWGGSVGFQFPLQKRNDPQFSGYDYYSEGDDYGSLQKYLVYVQYLITDDLLSCGFIKFGASSGHSLNDLNQSNYLGNKFEGGSFEDIGTFEGNKYRGMKVKIIGLDWNEEDLLDMDVLSISYNNENEFFNEYIAHPLQIKAMTDVTNMDGSGSMFKVMNKYIDYVINNTCFEIAHKESLFLSGENFEGNLPDFCNGTTSSTSDLVSFNYNPIKNIITKLVGKVYAFDLSEKDKKIARENLKKLSNPTMNGVDMYLWKAINSIKDNNTKSYLIRALTPGTKAMLKYKLNNGEQIGYNDLVFLKCNLNHDKVVKNIEYIFKKYYKNGQLNLESVEYLDPEFGDCIIPKPDKRHKNKLIQNSFLENKITFLKENFGKEKINKYEEEISNITTKYYNKIEKLKKDYKELIDNNKQEDAKQILKEIKKTYNNLENDINKLTENDPDIKKYIEVRKDILENTKKKDNDNKNNYIYFILGGLILIILAIILIAKKNKNEN